MEACEMVRLLVNGKCNLVMESVHLLQREFASSEAIVSSNEVVTYLL